MTSKTKIPPAPTWDLDSIFSGGSKSEAFKKHRQNVKTDLAETEKKLKELPESIDAKTLDSWVEFVIAMQSVIEDISLVMSFSNALSSANVADSLADAIYAEGTVYNAQWDKMMTELEARSLKQTDQQWQMLTSDPRLAGVAFYLNEVRTIAKSKMPVELESLALELAVNGYHAWNQIYDKMAGELKTDFVEDGRTISLSMGQLASKMTDPDRAVRRQAFEKLVGSWESRAELSAMMLNALAGFRLDLYKGRKWTSPIYEPLVRCRMNAETLDTMWHVVARETGRLKPYIEAKKKILGIDKFSWYDQFAPCGEVDKLYSFDEAGQFIYNNTKAFSPDLAEFVKMALAKRWVEAEDRSGKRGGGYCTGMGKFRQKRIFMTYSGTYENLLTLAHELGHAYHGWIMRDKPYFATIYPMNIAETASTFAEALVNDAALAQSTDPQEQLMLIEQKLQAAYTMFCDLHCRYIFERSFYDERREGVVGKERLSELMVAAQKKAFGPLLDESGYHPLFWCSKLHFYITDQPFYNFPYTFGHLFSGGVYARAKAEGPAFAAKYRDLLADTGGLTTEQLAKKHLGVDLTKEEFWVDAVNLALADVDAFVKLADKLAK